MNTVSPSKINQILQKLPKGAVATNAWLQENGVSNDLKKQYVRSKWLEPVGHGACKRFGDLIGWPGAVWGVIQQDIKLHVGGKTALGLYGLSHYVRIDEAIILFKETRGDLPKWFSQVLSKKQFRLFHTEFLPAQLCQSEMPIEGLNIITSQPERAILEHLYLVGRTESFEETSFLMEGLTGLRPNLLQKLLESCSSIKTKRLLLFFGEYHGHAWFKKLDVKKINLGKGKRQIVSAGMLDNKYQITIPKGFYGEKNIY